MDRDALREDLRADVVRRLRRPAAIEDHTTLAELGMDSAEVLELVADVEDRLAIVIPLDGLQAVRTFGQMVEHVHRRLR